MMSSIDEAIKAAIEEVLQDVRNTISEQEARCKKLEESYEELSGRVEERGREGQQFREELERHQSDKQSFDDRVKADLEDWGNKLKERLDRHENDEEGEMGLQQLRQKVVDFGEELTKMQAKIEEHSRTVGSSKSRTDSFEETVKDLYRQCEEFGATVTSSQDRLQQVIETSNLVSERQQVVEDSVAKKYESLWQDVLRAMDEMKENQQRTLREDLQRRSEDNRREGQSHVKYVTQLVATVHDERRKLAISKDLLTEWRQHTWTNVRRRTGLNWLCNALHGLAKQRERKFLNRWVRVVSIEDLAQRLREEYESKVPDVQKALEDLKITERCDQIEVSVETLRSEKCSKEHVAGLIQQHRSEVDVKLSEVDAAQAKVEDRAKSLDEVTAQHGGKHDEHTQSIQKVEETLSRLHADVSGMSEAAASFASSTDVQTVMRDTLLMWNSIKQLDVAKADKKDVDNFAVETSNRDRQSSRRFEDLQAEITDQLREETLRVQEKCSELDAKVEDSAKQFQHWEQMWERLAGFVEELVMKVGDLQGSSGQNRLLHGGGQLRSGSRLPSSRGTRPAQPETPVMPHHFSERSLHDSHSTMEPNSGAETTAESRMMYASSAKELGGGAGGLEQVLTHSKLSPSPTMRHRTPTRPMSATSVRRAVDRGR
eukprot:TRINITY_DN43110_c0_g1_i1.p1 TRINITY_DN43110_c0_g1~~TRINITY_DN43110_c0_g1_i1.p1  ORF type:complete len:657 (-),score=171.78 TRINITY_DN43110_c0_g1_i1:140-2110(-)